MRKLLIMGLPGAGKTTLARLVARRLNAVHFNADEVRAQLSPELGFGEEDRVTHARRMGWLCDQVTATGGVAVADFICPTRDTRTAFFAGGPGHVVFVDRIKEGRYADTNAMFEPPAHPDLIVTETSTPQFWCEHVVDLVRPVFDPKRATALFIGRWQPFHEGHKRLIEEGIMRVGQVCVAVRDMPPSLSDPFRFDYVKARIEHGLREYEGSFAVVSLPNIASVMYGRDVGYTVERIELDEETEQMSATQARKLMGAAS